MSVYVYVCVCGCLYTGYEGRERQHIVDENTYSKVGICSVNVCMRTSALYVCVFQGVHVY